MKLGLEGKTALITAASGGIGSGIAAALADAGVHVAISGRTSAALEQVAGRLASCSGGRPAIVVGDICAKGGPAEIAAEALAALGGRVDILVNNAGGCEARHRRSGRCVLGRGTYTQFPRRTATDRSHRARDEGSKLGSDRQYIRRTGAPKLNGAAPAKAALVSWSRTLSSELGAHGITVNTIAPGRINSAQIQKLHPTEQSRAEFIKQNIPAGYFGEPHDIGHLVAFLASPLARYINGAAIPVVWRGVCVRVIGISALEPHSVPEFSRGVWCWCSSLSVQARAGEGTRREVGGGGRALARPLNRPSP
jgi:3-oxoacyl-[acyl-carrier protein] reductase